MLEEKSEQTAFRNTFLCFINIKCNLFTILVAPVRPGAIGDRHTLTHHMEIRQCQHKQRRGKFLKVGLENLYEM